MDTHVADVIALAADGSYRDALGITQKVMMSSSDTILTVDEVSDIVGAPRSALLSRLLEAVAEKDAEKGLSTLGEVATSSADIKLFYKLFLERIRAVMLLRHNPASGDMLTASFAPHEVDQIRAYAAASASPINSQFLGKVLSINEYIGKTSVSTLPFELLIIEHCTA